MRKKILMFVSILMSLCIPVTAQHNNWDSLLLRLEEFGKQTGVKVERIEKTHEYVDLGLSVKWATCNVGAEKPEECGNYYAWAETKTKSTYNISTYSYSKGTIRSHTKYCNDSAYGADGFTDNKVVLDAADDIAHTAWGDDWRMPTNEEFMELMNNCIWSWTTLNGVNGLKMRSKIPGYTDRSIFFPATGSYVGDDISSKGDAGNYWSSSLYEECPYVSWRFSFSSRKRDTDSSGYRSYGYTVRPVCP